MVDVPTAAKVLGIGRTTANQLVREGRFPCRLVRVGGLWRVPTAGLRELLGVSGMADAAVGHPHGSTPAQPLALDAEPERGSTCPPADSTTAGRVVLMPGRRVGDR
ncbi:helix-turn-helix domain-containing protein [Streptomyces sp. NPDC086554]|uniref:helix-turn-helix domain-containing protein n=1 Tax=Streptomyces sp. NPDC086554 TaxID=3154864 RepID=UPI003424F805